MTKEQKIKYIRELCIHANPSIVKVYNNWASTHDRDEEQYSYEERPICLADIILAAGQRFAVCSSYRPLQRVILNLTMPRYDEGLFIGFGIWNLVKDNLDEQSDECIDYLFSILSEHDSTLHNLA